MATIGFIGLGNMGGGMAANLAKGGHNVIAFDLSKDALDRAVAAGCVAGVDVRWKGFLGGRDVIEIRGVWTKGQSLDPAWSTDFGYTITRRADPRADGQGGDPCRTDRIGAGGEDREQYAARRDDGRDLRSLCTR